MTAKTIDPLVSPVTAQELANYINVPATDPVIAGLLLSATDAVIRILGYDLLPRAWTLTLWDWPIIGTRTSPNLSRSPYGLRHEINLPLAALQAVTSVQAYGVEVTDYIARENSVMLPDGTGYEAYGNNVAPALLIAYTAGLDPVPDSVKDSIKMLAAFLYEHRGECDVNDALARSGVSVMLQPFKKHAVVF